MSNLFTNIRLHELPVWLKVFKQDGSTAKEAAADLRLIDDLLTLQKSKSLLSRKKGLKEILDARIGYEVGDTKFKNVNRK